MNSPLPRRPNPREHHRPAWQRVQTDALALVCGGDEDFAEPIGEEPFAAEAYESYESYESYEAPVEDPPYEAPVEEPPIEAPAELATVTNDEAQPDTFSAGHGEGLAGGGYVADETPVSLAPSSFDPDANGTQGPTHSEPWLSLGVGTLRTLTGESNGSPIDSKVLVDTMRELGALGDGAARRFDRAAYNRLLSSDPSAPFTGQGATGVSPLATTVPLTDLASMARYHQAESDLARLEARRHELRIESRNVPEGFTPAMEERRQEALELLMRQNDQLRSVTTGVISELTPTVRDYRNPLSDRPGRPDPRDHFDDATREQQAKLLLEQPITTLHKEAYGDKLPTRGEVINAAAQKYNLDPTVLAGVILHEQRDQSRREDAADILGGTVAKRDTSIGLGQILMSTAAKDDASLLSDTVDQATRKGLSRDAIARLLTSDEHNIMATARYLRTVADNGADIGARPGSLPMTRREFPGLDTEAYRTSDWGKNPDNIRAIASEYTSKPWDDRVIPARGYPTFVLTAVEDIRRANVFGRR